MEEKTVKLQELTGTSCRILEVDLSKKVFSTVKVSDEDLTMYLGGKGLGLKMLYDRMSPGIDPLGEENIIAFMMGVLAGTTAPNPARFEAVTKSPLTGIMTSSSCGGPFGIALKTSGWDGLIIKGKAKKPVYLVVDSNGITFKDAAKLKGKNTQKTQEMLKAQGSGAVVIGPAGENLVRFANLCSGQRYLGRAGMGAVLGSKNLKAVVAKGKEFKIVPADIKKFETARTKALKYINSNIMTSVTYRKYGTPANVNMNNAAGILPVNNFTGGNHKDSYNISGEYMAETFKTKYHSCKPCNILCGHKGTFAGRGERPVPEFETISIMGSNLGIFDPVAISEWNDICSEMGMDTISCGGTIAWVMEAGEKGIIKTGLKFGSAKGISAALKDMAMMKGFGKEMAMGSRFLSRKYGGEDFAIQVKGLEMPGYDPRGAFGQGLSYATANRGACHVSTSIFALEAYFGFLNPYSSRAKAEVCKYFENFYAAINSLHTCLFTAFAYTLEPPLIKYTPKFMLKFFMMNFPKIALMLMDVSLFPELWSSITGKKLTSSMFLKAGERTHVLERYMNTREGISRKDDTLPGRLLHEGRGCDEKKRTVPLEIMLDQYYKKRGFDKNGIPKASLLKKLGIIKK
jgi:aldehyde:ferredoxin oxidoreductase